jgi:NADPH-dependent 2,4-dienoyl-CoA reductase/sulfur reductase-like enzyme
VSRSPFPILHQRYGSRTSGAGPGCRVVEHYERARAALGLNTMNALPATAASPGIMAIAGAGFAGWVAACVAKRFGVKVALLDPLGRVGRQAPASAAGWGHPGQVSV